ncbi:hypothetical protein HC723_09915 [Vibrio sp. S11_S32]|uniref:hypothetical protein n=1 Tax=Vibrio sp. S11_S32 TaxID=2720225 RepID=UPI001681BA7B|nr:hypothetical protein [Vibrio sp. S11_S32]MBD1576752.1 hypothetical protein [Vibrio sp. S11_S32]
MIRVIALLSVFSLVVFMPSAIGKTNGIDNDKIFMTMNVKMNDNKTVSATMQCYNDQLIK